MASRVQIRNPRYDLAKAKVREAASKGIRKVVLAIEGNAAANAPVDTGALRASIYSETSDSNGRDESVGAAVGQNPAFEPTSAEVGINDELQGKVAVAAHYGTFVELGTEHTAAQPFLGPAFDVVEPQADAIVGAEIAKAIKGD